MGAARVANSAPILRACCLPRSDSFCWLAHFSISKPAELALPVTVACRNSTTWPPSRSSAQPASVACAGLSKKECRQQGRGKSKHPNSSRLPDIGKGKRDEKQPACETSGISRKNSAGSANFQMELTSPGAEFAKTGPDLPEIYGPADNKSPPPGRQFHTGCMCRSVLKVLKHAVCMFDIGPIHDASKTGSGSRKPRRLKERRMSPLFETVLFVLGPRRARLPGRPDRLSAYRNGRCALRLRGRRGAAAAALPHHGQGLFFHGAAPWALWTTYFTAVIVAWTAGHLAITRIFGRDGQAGVVGGVATAFSNLVLLGTPVVRARRFRAAGFRDPLPHHRRASAGDDDGLHHPVRDFRA